MQYPCEPPKTDFAVLLSRAVERSKKFGLKTIFLLRYWELRRIYSNTRNVYRVFEFSLYRNLLSEQRSIGNVIATRIYFWVAKVRFLQPSFFWESVHAYCRGR